MRTTHNLIQGSPEWHAYRAQHFNASDAPAMLGISKYKTRAELLREYATGITEEHDAQTLARFERGHQLEAAARQQAAELIGDEVYPLTMSYQIHGLPLSASLDGATIGGEIIWEHKTLNQKISGAVSAGQIPDEYRAQMEQQLLVSGADKCLFMASDENNTVSAWYEPNLEMRTRILDGWAQFAADLKNYQAEQAEQPVIAAEVDLLPAIQFDTAFTPSGIQLTSNLQAYKAAAKQLVERSKKQLQTDQDFADAEARVKACHKAEKNIANVVDSVLMKTADVYTFTEELKAISELLRQCRLAEDKQIKSRKAAIKEELVNAEELAINKILDNLRAELAALCLQIGIVSPTFLTTTIFCAINFLEEIKGLSSIASIKNKLAAARLKALSAATAKADMIGKNILHIKARSEELAVDPSRFLDPATLKKEPAELAEYFELKAAEHKRWIAAEAQRLADEKARQEAAAAAEAARVEQIRQANAQAAQIATPAEQQRQAEDALLATTGEFTGTITAAPYTAASTVASIYSTKTNTAPLVVADTMANRRQAIISFVVARYGISDSEAETMLIALFSKEGA